MENLAEKLKEILGEKGWVTGAGAAPWQRDWLNRYGEMPLGVARPNSTAQVAQVMAACHGGGGGGVPQGGNTGLCGAAGVGAAGGGGWEESGGGGGLGADRRSDRHQCGRQSGVSLWHDVGSGAGA